MISSAMDPPVTEPADRLFFYVAVGFWFAHGKLADQNPLCLIDKADFGHFFFNGQRFFFKLPQALPGAFQPAEGIGHRCL